ncbi:MAG: hypothetical protein MUO89_04485 [Dehalococcoidia bacterium]|nr:hypothetical protein [Dehalococcoidia bacterium]
MYAGTIHFSSLARRHANTSFNLLENALAKRNIPFLVRNCDLLFKLK